MEHLGLLVGLGGFVLAIATNLIIVGRWVGLTNGRLDTHEAAMGAMKEKLKEMEIDLKKMDTQRDEIINALGDLRVKIAELTVTIKQLLNANKPN